MDLLQHYYEILEDKLLTWSDILVSHLPNLVVAVLVLTLFIVGARFVRNLAQKLFSKVTNNLALTRLGGNIIGLLVGGLGIFLFLSILNLDKTVTSLLAGAGILGLALSFAFQDTAANFISGVLIATRKPFSVGHHIRSNDEQGIVSRIGLRTTSIRTFQGQEVLIPNKDVFKQPLTNYSSTGERRVDLSVGVSYSDDLNKARKVAMEAIEALDCRDKSKAVTLMFTGFGSSSIDFDVRYWVNPAQHDFLTARSLGIVAIKQAFDANGITIPFPMRTLEFNPNARNPLPLRVLNGSGAQQDATASAANS